jgi:hypothetical protein
LPTIRIDKSFLENTRYLQALVYNFSKDRGPENFYDTLGISRKINRPQKEKARCTCGPALL